MNVCMTTDEGRITKVSGIHPLGTIGVWTKFNGNTAGRCCDVTQDKQSVKPAGGV